MIRRQLAGLLLGMACFGIYAAWLSPFAVLGHAQDSISDTLTRWAYDRSPLPQELPEFVLVAVDDDSYRRLNLRWPFDRKLHAELVNRLAEASPKLICMDMFFGGETNSESDQAVARALQQAGNVIIASYFGENNEYVRPLELIQKEAKAVGSVNRKRIRDFQLRSSYMLHFTPAKDLLDYSLEVHAAAAILGASPRLQGGSLELVSDASGSIVRRVPIAPDGSAPIQYRVAEKNVKTIPFAQVLQGQVPHEALRDKVILIGNTGSIFQDRHPTPLGNQPGVVIVLNILLNLLRSDFPIEVPKAAQSVLVLASAILFGLAAYCFSAVVAVALGIVWVGVFAWLSVQLYFQNIVWDYVGVPFVVGSVLLLGLVHRSTRLAIESARLRIQATTDGLTGISNLQYFQVRLMHAVEQAKQERQRLAVVMFDMDGFKQINDQLGHQAGNEVLIELVRRLRQRMRKSDLLARFGGDEFCILLFRSDEKEAWEVAETLRKSVESEPFATSAGVGRPTLSMGVAGIGGGETKPVEKLMEEADAALYASKRAGKNRVTIYTSDLTNSTAERRRKV